jgi:hypothetical protein
MKNIKDYLHKKNIMEQDEENTITERDRRIEHTHPQSNSNHAPAIRHTLEQHISRTIENIADWGRERAVLVSQSDSDTNGGPIDDRRVIGLSAEQYIALPNWSADVERRVNEYLRIDSSIELVGNFDLIDEQTSRRATFMETLGAHTPLWFLWYRCFSVFVRARLDEIVDVQVAKSRFINRSSAAFNAALMGDDTADAAGAFLHLVKRIPNMGKVSVDWLGHYVGGSHQRAPYVESALGKHASQQYMRKWILGASRDGKLTANNLRAIKNTIKIRFKTLHLFTAAAKSIEEAIIYMHLAVEMLADDTKATKRGGIALIYAPCMGRGMLSTLRAFAAHFDIAYMLAPGPIIVGLGRNGRQGSMNIIGHEDLTNYVATHADTSTHINTSSNISAWYKKMIIDNIGDIDWLSRV